MEVTVAKHAGFCFGVKRAVRIALDAAKSKRVYTLGPLIHNPPMVEEMRKKGAIPLSNLKDLDKGSVIIPSHGISPQVLKRIESRVEEIIDATCPFVKSAREEAIKLDRECEQLIIVGDREHPEIKGILPFLRDTVLVVRKASEIPDKSFSSCGIIAQTTMSESIFKHVVSRILSCSREVKIINTICDATRKRQSSTLELLRNVEVMIVVGGHNSANTRRLLEVCRRRKKPAYQVEDDTELRDEWFRNCQKVGVTAGASTPSWMIERILQKISSF
ncbi:MAG TPA: 4-hydroxy-3-methylbut-2-enyl diphosphate reductase [Candidatus Omnitrophica bacterium]|nr:4-hydroxy-3-methylbut-2-enyl diphosphate reductase [Candidatus Omnitrophota bacterium]